MTANPSRERPLEPQQSAVLFIDVQNYFARRDGGRFNGKSAAEMADCAYLLDQLDNVAVPNMQRLQAGFRAAGIEVLHTVVESLTQDGRDRSLDYKITGFNVPKGSWDALVLDAIAPAEDEIVIPKTASSVFNATNIDYVLRNLGVGYLVLAGILTDQCVESAVRDACDKGYLVTLVADACATYSQARHDNALEAISGYCRQRTTDALLEELAELTRAA
jgi:nicotinamidase-related amidase